MKMWFDKNGSWTPPVGATLQHVTAVGAFLRLTYVYEVSKGRVEIDIYLNDQGREVGRLGTTISIKGDEAHVNENSKSESKPRS